MAFVQECLQKLVELFYLTEERKVEKLLAHSLSNPKKINQNLKRVFSNKYFRVFKKSVSSNGLEISISKKYFKLAVDRNASKRRIKEIVRRNGLGDVLGGDYVFSVFRPFAELSYMQAEAEIAIAIKQITKE
tara:strand:- start:241 stop:636 length:396 start_codon:yes stop_codon:yes gene_type:complete